MATRINPSKGAKPDKLMRDALMLELAALQPGTKERRARLVARALVDAAIDKQVPAMREIFDRVDGKDLVQSQAMDVYATNGGGPDATKNGIRIEFVSPTRHGDD